MRIAAINSTYSRPAFKASAGGTMQGIPSPPDIDDNNTPQKRTGCLGCLGNLIYAGVLANVFVLTPITINDLGNAIDERTQFKSSDMTDYNELSGKLHQNKGTSTAFYQLNKLHDVEDARIKKMGKNQYGTTFALDNEVISLIMNVNPDNKYNINGVMSVAYKNAPDENAWIHDYSIQFSKDKAEDFTMKIKSRQSGSEEKTMIFKRLDNELFLIDENGKKSLNKENVADTEKYNQLYDKLVDDYESARDTQQTNILIGLLLTALKMFVYKLKDENGL